MNLEGGRGRSRQKKGKTYENNSCTPSNPKKYSSPGLKKKIIEGIVKLVPEAYLTFGDICPLHEY